MLLMLVNAIAMAGKGQSFSFSDLFNQAGKQKQYYLQQIAAYEAFESELKMGYNVIQHGLTGIAVINTAELNAHGAYYQSLQQVSQAVKSNPKVQDIMTLQSAIIKSFSASFPGLSTEEQSYIRLVQTDLLNACNEDMTALQNLLAPGTLQLTDDQRLSRLNRIHAAMLDKYEFCQSFCNSVRLLQFQKQQETNDLQTLKEIQ